MIKGVLADHDLRYALTNELHARPFAVLDAPRHEWRRRRLRHDEKPVPSPRSMIWNASPTGGLSLSPGQLSRRPSASTTVFKNLVSGSKYLTVLITT